MAITGSGSLKVFFSLFEYLAKSSVSAFKSFLFPVQLLGSVIDFVDLVSFTSFSIVTASREALPVDMIHVCAGANSSSDALSNV